MHGHVRCRGLAGLVPLGLALGLAASGCARPAGSPPARPSAPLVLVGVDGLEWSVALPLVREGRMPHLEALMRRGSFGRLETIAPGKSPVIWTTIATGRRPEEHGILDFTLDGPDGQRRLFTSADRRTKALWNILTDAKRRSVFVSWWNTFPVEPTEGILVSQANTLEQIARRKMLKPGGMLRGVDGQVHPAARQDEMLEIAGQVERELPEVGRRIFGDLGRPRGRAEEAILETCAWSIRADEATRRIALRLAAESPAPDLFAVYFGMPDVVAHRFWRFHEPAAFAYPPSAEAVERFGEVVRDAYVHIDEVIGELVAALPPGATILVVSDHGMHAHNTSSRFDVRVHGRLELESGAHKDGPPGMFVAAGDAVRCTEPRVPPRDLTPSDLPDIGHVMDVAPTILALLGIPVGRDMGGAVLEHVLADGVLQDRPVTYVDTHDTPEWRTSRGRPAPDVPGTEERLEQLRSLGYIEDPDRGARE
jgi:hypothetical protein